MEINNTKPLAGLGPLPEPAEEAASAGKNTFAQAQSKLQSAAPGGLQASGVSALAGFDRTALQDPAKLNEIVHALASSLIDSAQNVTGPLAGDDKKTLSEFLAKDPLIRGEIESYLKKVLV